MQPLDAFPEEARRRVKGVLVDIDDTLTTDGPLTAAAYVTEAAAGAGFAEVADALVAARGS